ncbi:MAG: phosphate ABC transporter permease PstA [Candidatus Methylacidiphilales bacterium]|nr:phosphate ABC transporter permease PstA [Candidatus Methylacidiphilales bacterium]
MTNSAPATNGEKASPLNPDQSMAALAADLHSNPVFTRANVFTALFAGASYTLSGVLVAILLFLLWHGGRGLSLDFIFSRASPTSDVAAYGTAGVFDMLYGTICLVALMILAVMPVGIITGVYLCEYTDPKSTLARITRSAVNNLAGVPSIIFGMFGLGFFIYFLGGSIDSYLLGSAAPVFKKPSLLWAALTLAVLTLPVVIVSTEQALRAVPRAFRDAALGLGATKAQTLVKVVLPQAAPGIITGGILAVSRGAGEVAPIMLTGATIFSPTLPGSLTDKFMELSYHIYIMCTQPAHVEAGRAQLYSTVVVLLFLTFFLNVAAIVVRAWARRFMRRMSANI